MSGLEFPGLATLLVLASAPADLPSVSVSCASMARPVIEVTTSENPVAFDTKKSKEELAQLDIDTVSPWPASYHTEVGGVMQGLISVNHRVRFKKDTDPESGLGCVWFENITVDIHIDPTIYIAHDFEDQECWFREVFTHEIKHVTTDRTLMDKYAGQLSDGLNMIFMEPADYESGPVPVEVMGAVQEEMHSTVQYALGVVFAKMMRERAERQQGVDNLYEYQRISGRCARSS